MDGLPPPAGAPADQPAPPPSQPKQPLSSRAWLFIALGIIAAIVIVMVLPESEDEPDPPTRAEVAEQTWDSMGARDRAALCDGYNQFGETFALDNLIEGADGDERLAEAMLDVIRDEC